MNSTFFSCLLIWLLVWSSSCSAAFNFTSDHSAEKISDFLNFRAMVLESWPFKDESLDDIVMLRFFLASDFDLIEGLTSIKSHLLWRKFEKIDGILEEDWRDMEHLYPYQIIVASAKSPFPITGGAIKNSIVLHWHLGSWSLPDAISSEEKSQRFTRYASGKMMEDADRKALELFSKSVGQLNSTHKFQVVVNMAGHPSMEGIVHLVEMIAKEWTHATELFHFTNVPNVPDFVCRWSPEGKLSCPNDHSEMGNGNEASWDKLEL